MSSSNILTEMESGLSDVLIKLLLLFGKESSSSDSSKSIRTNMKGDNKKNNLIAQIMKNKLSISVKTMEFILIICNDIGKVEWEKHVS